MINIKKDIGFFLSVLGFLGILNLALYFRIPLILQISALIALCIVPGYLLRLIFKIHAADPLENFLYSIGLSIIFDLFLGLGLNILLPVLGDTSPLSPKNLQIFFSVIILAMTAWILYTDRVPIMTLLLPEFGRIEKLLLIFGMIMLVCIETGIYLINSNMTNLVLIFSILLIPLLLLLCIIYHENVMKRIYPVILVLIGASLVMILALRSNYIFGVDINEEYFLFIQTLTHSQWYPDMSLLLSSSLSISILPTVFENFMFIDSHLLYKLLYPLLFLVVTLIIYTTVKKYFSELLALFSACFFMFQNYFVAVSQIARTAVAIFFFSFIVMVICNTELTNAKKYPLLLLFIIGAVFSHYTSSFIFLFILALAYMIDQGLTKVMNRLENRYLLSLILPETMNRKENSPINFSLILFFLCFIFFWYQQIITFVFSTGLKFTVARPTILVDLWNNDVKAYSYVVTYIPPPTLMVRLINYSRLALLALIGLGVLFTLYEMMIKRSPHNSGFHPSDEIGGVLVCMGWISVVFYFLTIFAEPLFHGYDTGRTQAIIFTILPLFLITGVFTLFNPKVWEEILLSSKYFFPRANVFIRSHKEKIAAGIILILLVPQLLGATYIANELTGGPYSIALNSPRYSAAFDPTHEDPAKFSYIFDQDAAALQWFRDHSDRRARIFSDSYGNKKITAFVNRSSSLYQQSLFDLQEEEASDAFIFFTFANEYFGHFRNWNAVETDISSADWITSRKSKIFSNGAVLYR